MLGVAVSSVERLDPRPRPAAAAAATAKAGWPSAHPARATGCRASRRSCCGSCDRYLPLTAFNRAGDGHQHWCRDCFVDYFRERGDTTPRSVRGPRRRRRRDARASSSASTCVEHPCVDCGEDEILVLEFDHHRGEKTAAIARLLASRRAGSNECGARSRGARSSA